MKLVFRALLSLYASVVVSTYATADDCGRIVSLAPSITESVFAVGLGERVVGATRFCRYPEAALKIPRVGGFYDVNIEEVVRLKPSIVFGLREHAESMRTFRALQLNVVELDHSHVPGIKEGLIEIGRRCGVESAAQGRVSSLEIRERNVQNSTAALPRVRVLVSVGRSTDGGGSPMMYVSGSDGFYSDVLELANAENVNRHTTMSVPTLSEEGLRALAPQAIVDIVNADDPEDVETARRFWSKLSSLPAVAAGRVLIESDDYASIPGPRYIDLVEKLAQQLHDKRGDAQ